MNQDETLNSILAVAISTAQSNGRNAPKAAEDAAEAYRAGLAAFNKATPVVEGGGRLSGQLGGALASFKPSPQERPDPAEGTNQRVPGYVEGVVSRMVSPSPKATRENQTSAGPAHQPQHSASSFSLSPLLRPMLHELLRLLPPEERDTDPSQGT